LLLQLRAYCHRRFELRASEKRDYGETTETCQPLLRISFTEQISLTLQRSSDTRQTPSPRRAIRPHRFARESAAMRVSCNRASTRWSGTRPDR